MELRKLISILTIITLMIPMFFFASPSEADARATYQIIRTNNGVVTGGQITIGQTGGTAILYHQPQNDQTRTETPLNGRTTYNVTCNGHYSVHFFDSNGKLLRFDAWNVANLGVCGR